MTGLRNKARQKSKRSEAKARDHFILISWQIGSTDSTTHRGPEENKLELSSISGWYRNSKVKITGIGAGGLTRKGNWSLSQ